jgi:hypothetical protein
MRKFLTTGGCTLLYFKPGIKKNTCIKKIKVLIDCLIIWFTSSECNKAYLIIEALCVLDKILPHDSLDLLCCCNLKPLPIALPSFFLHALLFLRLALVMHIAEISLTRCEPNNQAINQYFYFLDTCIFFLFQA